MALTTYKEIEIDVNANGQFVANTAEGELTATSLAGIKKKIDGATPKCLDVPAIMKEYGGFRAVKIVKAIASRSSWDRKRGIYNFKYTYLDGRGRIQEGQTQNLYSPDPEVEAEITEQLKVRSELARQHYAEMRAQDNLVEAAFAKLKPIEIADFLPKKA